MESLVDKSLARSDTMIAMVEDSWQRSPGLTGATIVPQDHMGALGHWREDGAYRERYSLFRGVLYSAVNALATEAASQPVCMGKIHRDEEEKRPVSYQKASTPLGIDPIPDSPLLTMLEQPNPIQGRWQFVYSFVANLCLTGWSYIVAGDFNGRLELYSLPTTWVHPVHDGGPFSSFKIRNPGRAQAGGEEVELSREQVAFAYLPDPSDPMSAIAPASSQMQAIRADDSIWASREQFFENGIFPGAIVTIGKDPHPDVPAGIRPRLTASQRRQVHAAIQKIMSGVANYGNPAIVDGMIEKIERLSATTNEMGWEKSAQDTKAAILSAFCVHPYILGEAVGVGGYAQVAAIERRFIKRVNVYLDMLSSALTNFLGTVSEDPDLRIWWQPVESDDEDLKWRNIWAALAGEVMTKNEVRSQMGLPPMEAEVSAAMSTNDIYPVVAVLTQMGVGAINGQQASALLAATGVPQELADQLGGVTEVPLDDDVEPIEEPPVPSEMAANIIALLGQVGFGAITPEQAAALMEGMGIPADVAAEVAGLDFSLPLPTPEMVAITAELKRALITLKESAKVPELIEDLRE